MILDRESQLIHVHKSTFSFIFSLGALYAFKALMLNVYVVSGPVPKIPFAVFPICAKEMRLSYHIQTIANEDYAFFTSIKRRSCWTLLHSIIYPHHLFIPSYSFHHLFIFIRFYIDSSQVDLRHRPPPAVPLLISIYLHWPTGCKIPIQKRKRKQVKAKQTQEPCQQSEGFSSSGVSLLGKHLRWTSPGF